MTIKTVPELHVVLANTPGSMAKAVAKLAAARVNIVGMCQAVEQSGKTARWDIVVSNPSSAKKALKSVVRRLSVGKVLAVQVKDKPGVIAKVSRALGDQRINIENLYFSTPGSGKDTVFYLRVQANAIGKVTRIIKGL